MQIWDTAGQESFQSITKIFYRGTQAVLLTYDITSMESFLSLQKWYNEVLESAEPDVLVFLIANKVDRESDREVSYEKGQAFCD